jgi:Spy/CpxP family protein refolding chaperone
MSALALALALTAAPAAWAQSAIPVSTAAPPDPIEQRVFPPEFVMGHANEIGLTDDQRDRIIAEVKRLQGQAEAVMPQMERARDRMVSELDADPVNEARVLIALDGVLSVERDVKRLHIATLVRIRNLLTTAQRARLDALR